MDIKKQWREKDGRLIHDGDCYFWDRKVCTCGLLCCIAQLSAEQQEKVYPHFAEDQGQQRHMMDYLLTNRPEPLVPMTKEEAKSWIDMLNEKFCKK